MTMTPSDQLPFPPMSTPNASCPSCGSAASGRFCSSCGTALAGAVCASCAAPLTLGAHFCHRCGTPAGAPAAPGTPHRGGGIAGKCLGREIDHESRPEQGEHRECEATQDGGKHDSVGEARRSTVSPSLAWRANP